MNVCAKHRSSYKSFRNTFTSTPFSLPTHNELSNRQNIFVRSVFSRIPVQRPQDFPTAMGHEKKSIQNYYTYLIHKRVRSRLGLEGIRVLILHATESWRRRRVSVMSRLRRIVVVVVPTRPDRFPFGRRLT